MGVYWVVGPNVVPDVEVIGTLQPGNDATPRNACGSTMPLLGVGGSSLLPPDALKILVGSNPYVSSSKITAIEIGRCSVLTMERTATGINVGAELYGANGQLIARIVNNEFHAISGANSRIERQNDLSTLVVKDGKGIELLYVRYLNRTTIRARGIFGCPDHQPVAFTDEGQVGASRNACFTVGRTAVHID